MFAFPLVHDLVASTPEEKTQARELVDDIVGKSLTLSVIHDSVHTSSCVYTFLVSTSLVCLLLLVSTGL